MDRIKTQTTIAESGNDNIPTVDPEAIQWLDMYFSFNQFSAGTTPYQLVLSGLSGQIPEGIRETCIRVIK